MDLGSRFDAASKTIRLAISNGPFAVQVAVKTATTGATKLSKFRPSVAVTAAR